MAYSTITEFRSNVSQVTISMLADAIVTDRISVADKIIETDLSKFIDFTSITSTPNFINLLSQYKTAELSLVYLYSKKRDVDENSDINYWRKEYDDLMKKIINGDIEITDGTGISISTMTDTFSNNAKSNIKPILGVGEFGEFVSKSDLEKDRPID